VYFEWDEEKRKANLRKHGIDFRDVEDMFRHPMLTVRDERVEYGEERWVSVGWIKSVTGVVIYTEQIGDVIRVISARKATSQEVRRYVQRFEN